MRACACCDLESWKGTSERSARRSTSIQREKACQGAKLNKVGRRNGNAMRLPIALPPNRAWAFQVKLRRFGAGRGNQTPRWWAAFHTLRTNRLIKYTICFLTGEPHGRHCLIATPTLPRYASTSFYVTPVTRGTLSGCPNLLAQTIAVWVLQASAGTTWLPIRSPIMNHES